MNTISKALDGEQAFEPIITSRLILRQPVADDAASIFRRYASDPEVTRFLGWPRHTRVSDTDSFLILSASEWARWPAGPLLIESRTDGTLLGSTGLAFESPQRASTGYVLARDAWGSGFASEALAAVVKLARAAGVTHLYALCHPSHAASIRVLERCDFVAQGILPKPAVFPNLGDGRPQDVAYYGYAGNAALQSRCP
jgi:RimJ/RimL family protein N-acetyltransferase